MSQFATFVSAGTLASLLVVSSSVQAQTAAAAPANSAAAPANSAAAPANSAAAPTPEVGATVAAAPAEAAPIPVAPAPAAELAPRRQELRYLPRRMRYHRGEEVPENYVLESSPRMGLVIGGAAAIGVPYITGLILSGSSGWTNQGGWLAIPVAGPWLTYSLRKDCATSACLSSQDAASNIINTFLLIDGAVQAAGAAMLVLGFVFQREDLVRKDLASVWVIPSLVGKDGYGLSAVGRF